MLGGVKPRILVVDDEPDVLELISFNLKAAGYDVVSAADGRQALARAKGGHVQLIILDLMIPEMDGLEVCKNLRRDPETASIPILILTAKATEVDRVLGLELGADDYVTKPFSPRELVLRVKRLLRPLDAGGGKPPLMSGKDLTVDIARHEVRIKGKPVELTATEFKLLTLLMERRGRVQSRDQLLRDVWEYDSLIDTRTVDTHVRRLREKLGSAAKYLDTVRGIGYRFVD